MKMKVPKARITLDLERELLEWVSRYADTHGKSRNEAIGEAVASLKKRVEGEQMLRTLQDLTGRESGIVVYGSNGIICNWAGIEGLPMIAPTGLVGTGESVPEVAGTHVDDLAPHLEGVDITIAVSGYVEDSHPLESGTVYELGDDVIIITPDGWI